MGYHTKSLVATAGTVLLMLAGVGTVHAQKDEPIKIGFVGAISGQSAISGQAITRGLRVAIDEINADGGVLGRDIELVRRDDESNPGKGVAAARELIFREDVATIFGGIDSPVSLAIVPLINREGVPFMDPWAAATGITRNGASPNYAFRVSAMDALVDRKLMDYAQTEHDADKVGLMLINNPWGESNEEGLKAAAKAMDAEIVGVETFGTDDVDMVSQLTRLREAGAESLILVSNVKPAAQMIKSMDRMEWDVPVVSHWGISGGRFRELAGPTAEEVHFVQTYSFYGDLDKDGQRVLSALKSKYDDIEGPGDIVAPVGTANAYDAMHIVARGIEKAGSTDHEAIRKAMEDLDTYDGLIKTYAPPFTQDDHDALGPDDYIMVRFNADGEIVPVD